MDPASIRTNNPGAQWLGPTAQAYGATASVPLPGGNNAASFPDPVSGAAAQFALLGKGYTNMPLGQAISKWSGGNSSPAYAAFIAKQTGLSPDTVLTPQLLQGPEGVALAKAQAHWEAGKEFPLSDDQWKQAQSMAFGGAAAPMSGGAQPSNALLSPASMSAAPPPNLPLFGAPAGAPAAAPSPATQAGNFFASLPASAAAAMPQQQQMLQAPPIPMPQAPNVDMSALQAFLRAAQQPFNSR